MSTGTCNGSFGEILQGVLPAGRKFLVNLPIKNASTATVTLSPPTYDAAKEAAFSAAYARWPKAHKAVRHLLTDLEEYSDFQLAIESDIPVGKGLSSSTADMVAALRATEKEWGRWIGRIADIDGILRRIEPNDGIQYPGTAVYFHEEGALMTQYDYVPAWVLLGFDEGGMVDTVALNALPRVWSEESKKRWEQLLEEAQGYLMAEDGDRLASIATTSADIWQLYHPKGHYEAVSEFALKTDAIGIVNTHSGTLLGVIYPAGTPTEGNLHLAQTLFPECDIQVFETVSA